MFTQTVLLSDESTLTIRTTSPKPTLKLSKDTRNHVLWNPSAARGTGDEEDVAGRRKAFAQRFGGMDFDFDFAPDGPTGQEVSKTPEPAKEIKEKSK